MTQAGGGGYGAGASHIGPSMGVSGWGPRRRGQRLEGSPSEHHHGGGTAPMSRPSGSALWPWPERSRVDSVWGGDPPHPRMLAQPHLLTAPVAHGSPESPSMPTGCPSDAGTCPPGNTKLLPGPMIKSHIWVPPSLPSCHLQGT
jgi:hypothetical protein